MENNNLYYNINNMARNDYYRTAKELAVNLGLGEDAERAIYPRGNINFWRTRVQGYRNQQQRRETVYNRALAISRRTGVAITIPITQFGTDYNVWQREVRRLQQQERRNSRFYREAQQARNRVAPILAQVRQPNNLQRQRQQRRVRQIQQELQQQARRQETQRRINRMITGNQFQNILNMVVNDNQTLTNQQAQRVWNNITGQGNHILTITFGDGREQIIAVNATTRDFIIDILINGLLVEEQEQYGSDIIDNLNIRDIQSLTIERLRRPERRIVNRDGRFFPYVNTTNEDLSKYQVFNQEQAYDQKLVSKREHCLIHTLTQAGIETSVINNIKMSYIQDNTDNTVRIAIRKKDLHNISNIIKRNIVVHTMNGKRIAKQVIKAEEAVGEDINMSMYENHYFLFEDTKYSKYSIINYEELKDEEDFNNIIKTVKKKDKTYNYKDENKSKINSLLLVDKFFKAQYFKKLDLCKFEESNTHEKLKEHIYLDNIDNEQRLCEEKKEKKTLDDMGINRYTEEKKVIKATEKLTKKEKPKQEIYYADCESFVKDVDYHKLYLLGVVNDKSDIVDIYNICDQPEKEDVSREQQVVYKFFNNITKNGTTNALVYFHNLKYDYHLLERLINIKDRCEKDGQLYNIVCKYKGKEIELRDSYKILPFALSKFGSEFNLPKEIRKKEAIAYNYYKEQNNNRIIKAKEYRKLLSSKEKTIFKDAVKQCPSYNIEDKTFNPLTYYQEYLRLDCLVLKKGIQTFNKLIQEITENKMNVYDSLTISSLTDKYMKKEGAYEGVYEVQGNLRAYIAQAVYGGRVCVNPKYKKKVIKGKISDYDGVSLYPSAINRLCRIMGLPTGKAKRFEKDEVVKEKSLLEGIYHIKNWGGGTNVAIYDGKYYIKAGYKGWTEFSDKDTKMLTEILEGSNKSDIREFENITNWAGVIDDFNFRFLGQSDKIKLKSWRTAKYSILTVKINKVNKIQQMPFIAHKTEDSIKYTNTAPEKPIIIDSITLEDYIKFHEIEYELLDGVYWDGGSNKKMGEVIQRLFNARLQAKKEGKTALSNTIKLMLNSSYGKTIMKKSKTAKQIIKTETKKYNKTTKQWEVKSKTNFKDYIYNNFNTIRNYRKLNENNYEVEKTCADNSFNRGHIGCAILSISKRIMNEVFDVANDNKYPIYYTDTDSLHCNLEDVPKLEAKYKERYNKELNGKQLEQFHTDFDLDGAKEEIYATKSIFLGKKSYMDYLESKDENGNTIHGFHIRLKGITKEGLEHTAKQYNNSYIGLYEDLAKGNEKKIILNPYNPDTNENKVLFEFKEGKVSTKKEFTRVVKF